jgi:uncharacterized protein YbaP (TraB family)
MYFEIPGTNIRLMGSMHRLPADSPGLPGWTTKAYDWCDELVFESDISIMPPLYPVPGVDLKANLTANAWSSLQDLWPLSDSLPPLEKVQPWAAFLFGSAFSMATSVGVEHLFLQWAGNDSKVVHFLETPAQFAQLAENVPLQEVVQSIESLASDLAAPQRTIEAMYQAWIARDLSALYDVALQSPSFKLPELRRAVLERRNLSWLPLVEGHMKTSKPTLIAVGALHLYGPGNLLDLLGCEAKLLSCD